MNNLIVDKETNKYRQGVFLHDLISPVLIRKGITPIPVWEDDNNVYFYIHTINMGNFVKMIKQKEVVMNEDNKISLSSLSEDSNPVIICYSK